MEFNLHPAGTEATQKVVPLDTGRTYDTIIIGGGPSALTAAVYCMRKGVSTALITDDFGGQVAETSSVENYMGYKYIEGSDLSKRFREQVEQFEIAVGEGIRAQGIEDGKVKIIALSDGRTARAKSVIISSGKSWRKLGVPGEKELTGRGVAYCATCDAPLFAGRRVMVVGGGNSALESAIDLARIAEHVTVVQFLDAFTGDRILVDSLKKFNNVTTLFEHEVKEIRGTRGVESVLIRDRKSGNPVEVPVHGIFIEIGLVPNTDFVKGVLDLNELGEIIVDCACRTSRAGIFAAGDVTSVPFKQIIIAAGEGAKAALSACEYVLRGA